jgi:integrase
VPFRYVWPSELDLMARLAVMTLRERWGGWRRVVRGQLDRNRERVEFGKTSSARREVNVPPFLVKLLREHKAAARFSKPGDYVFATTTGRAPYYRNVTKRGHAAAVEAAGLNADGLPPFRWHDMRHCYVSMLIAEGLDLLYVARQAGHASVKETLDRYAHLFDRTRHAERAREALEQRFGAAIAGVTVRDERDKGGVLVPLPSTAR